MILEFNQQEEDLYTFYQFNAWYDPDKKWDRRKITLIPTLGLLFVMYVVGKNQGVYRHTEQAIGFTLLALFCAFVLSILVPMWVIFKANQKVKIIVNSQHSSYMLGPRVYHFSEEGIQLTTRTTQRELQWTDIHKVKEHKAYYFLYLNTESALIIPKALLAEEEHRLEFEDLLKRKVKPKREVF